MAADPPNTTLSSAPPPEDDIVTGMETETPHPDALAIVRFPDGCPGAPLGVDQGLSAYEATYDTLGEMSSHSVSLRAGALGLGPCSAS